MLQFFIYGFLFFSFSLYLAYQFSAPSNKRNKKLPPSPPKFPVLGNLHQLGLHAHRSLHDLSRRYGSLMLLHLGSKPVIVASSSFAAREIMKTHDLNFSDRNKSAVAAKLLYDYEDISTAPYGEGWRQRRSICVLQLLSNRRVQSFQGVRQEEIAILLNKIKEQPVVNLSECFAAVTNDVICRVALGRKYSEWIDGIKFKELLEEFMVVLGSFNIGEFVSCLRWVNLFTVKKEEDEEDFVDVLLKLQRDNEQGFTLTRKNIKAIVLNMFAAGTDTSYTVLEWAMAEILRHPKVMERLQNEVREVGRGKSEIKASDVEEMIYLKAVIKETLRMYPPIPLLVPRRCSEDVEIGGYHVPAGNTTIVNAWAIGRDSEIWEQPEEFRPERFLSSSVDFRGQDFELIPFGAGRRGCPGISFAMATNELVLANLVNAFDWRLPGEMSGEQMDMTECPGITIHRRVNLVAIAMCPKF
ncbi:Cytochrome P450 736A117 [Linum perenne]